MQAREAAQEAVRRSEENLEAARARAAEAAGATKSQAQQAAEQAVHEAEQTAGEAREKVPYHVKCSRCAYGLSMSSIRCSRCLSGSSFALHSTDFPTAKDVLLASRRTMYAHCTQTALHTTSELCAAELSLCT